MSIDVQTNYHIDHIRKVLALSRLLIKHHREESEGWVENKVKELKALRADDVLEYLFRFLTNLASLTLYPDEFNRHYGEKGHDKSSGDG